jgi:hypothetical protein
MAATTHKGYTAAAASVLTTELNSLASAATSAASAAIDNTTNLDLYVDLELVLATQASSRLTGPTVSVYLTQALDGTNYTDTVAAVAELVAVFTLDVATTARRVSVRDIPVPPGLFKLFVVNSTGQAFAASGNTLKARYHSILTN